jgi:hypothetical protein
VPWLCVESDTFLLPFPRSLMDKDRGRVEIPAVCGFDAISREQPPIDSRVIPILNVPFPTAVGTQRAGAGEIFSRL